MDWNECRRTGMAKEIKPDKNLVASLLKASDKKLESSRMLPLNDTTAASKLSLAYDALRELLEALGIMEGYKIYNHECYGALLSEILQESAASKGFDDFRKLRNKINYYGRDISASEAKSVIGGIESLIKTIKTKFFSG